MPWLLRDGDVLAVVTEGRGRGWRESLQGAVIIRPPAMVHTLTAGVSLDVAWCANLALEDGRSGFQVRRLATIAPRRVGPPLVTSGALVVAAASTFERWHLKVGDHLEVRGQ
jgi:hypothetical protein